MRSTQRRLLVKESNVPRTRWFSGAVDESIDDLNELLGKQFLNIAGVD